MMNAAFPKTGYRCPWKCSSCFIFNTSIGSWYIASKAESPLSLSIYTTSKVHWGLIWDTTQHRMSTVTGAKLMSNGKKQTLNNKQISSMHIVMRGAKQWWDREQLEHGYTELQVMEDLPEQVLVCWECCTESGTSWNENTREKLGMGRLGSRLCQSEGAARAKSLK